ncbi:MAG: YegS/Rv2252/BmrU family lipid kinase [Bacteroidales bacterium]|jgi:diacylglycerol kinase (ATP)|nr:YegS/Rv2252/BmrU family lipid kinase [Bacteroidales bacterium]
MVDKIIFIINPVSGKKKKKNIPVLIKKTFDNEDEYKIVYTSFAGEATIIAKKYLNKGYKKFIAIGGDGTVNEVASAIVDTDAILGILPLGSGNGLARHLKIPLKLQKGLNIIKKGNHKKIDYGEINDHKFFCTTGVGFDAHVGHVFSKLEKRGFSNYIRTTVSEFRRYQPKRYEISMNGTTIMRDAFLITFANASQYGNNAHIAPKAIINDGKLEIAIMRSFPLITAPGIGARLFLKNIDKSNYLETYRCKSIVVKRNSPDVIHYDGEPGKMGEVLYIKIVPKGLNVFVN